MSYWRNYHMPDSVAAALDLLAAADGQATVLAGGTDLLLEIQQGRKAQVDTLVDVTRIPEMREITLAGDWVTIGAAVTHSEIVESALLREQAACLVESCGVIGGPQVRNVATLGGNVAHALPGGDGTLALVALQAEAEVATRAASGVRCAWHPLLSLFKGPGESAVDRTREVIVRFRLPRAAPGEGSAFQRIMRPQGVALPILGMAVWLQVDGHVVDAVRIALGPAGPTPLRARQAERYLTGIPLVEGVVSQVADLIAADARLRSSKHRASSEYRRELVEVLLRRTSGLALQRAHAAQTGA